MTPSSRCPGSKVSAADVSGKRDLRETPPGTAARHSSEAIVAAFITISIIVTVAGVVFGAYLRICCAIRGEDRARSLPYDAPNSSARAARSLTGVSGSRWD
jgi:hypothetical protein